MRQARTVPAKGRAPTALIIGGVVAAALGLSVAGGVGCTLLLDTSNNPQKCSTDADCARFPNAACDNARRQCVPKLPYGSDAGTSETGAGGAGACELWFDNSARIAGNGPDGGLRPLPTDGP
jgi:hypothetical protein